MSAIPFIHRITISREDAEEAFELVQWDLWKRGVLWEGSKLGQIKLKYHQRAVGDRPDFRNIRDILTTAASDIGKFIRGKSGRKLSTEGYWWNGYIHIPHYGFWLGRQASIEDVIRHEFGHALADLYPRALSKGGLFRKAFGGTYGPTPVEERGVEGWEDRYVSEYATSATEEDFAETFMLFVKHKGKMPRQFAGKPAIKKKWAAVAEIVKRVAAATK